ncbi:MAG: 3-phosphoglycerate dehydrogenase [Leptolyngbyaceae cyanobacterium SL_7_1]|nr:3-phosphoglycerate dehydrogenase [Leptolyngbyaceae cyanobacterium SL_7_1]
MKIVLPDHIDLLESDRAAITQLGDVTVYDDIPQTEDELIERIAGAELITASWVDITEHTIQSSPALKYIIAPAVGYDQINVEAAATAGIRVLNCPTHNAQAVAEYTIGLIFAVTRYLLPANKALQNGEWNPRAYRGTELAGKILGLIGHGNSGKAVERLATALEMQVEWSSSKTPAKRLDELIARADILSLHLPLSLASWHLLDERRLGLMKPTAYLINTARGAIVEQAALLTVLQEKRIAGAALDVFENEPITDRPSEQILALAQLDNVVATPHIAYNTDETTDRLGKELICNLESCLHGEPINLVN